MPVISGGNVIAGAQQRQLTTAGVPTSGTSGSFAGSAPPGAVLADTTNGVVYQNTGTQASPTWTEVPNLLAGGLSFAELMSAMAVPRLRVYSQTVGFAAFTDGGGAVGTLDLGVSIPAGAVFLRSLIKDLIGFTGDTSATLTIGDGTDVDRYNTGTPSVFTTAAAGLDMGAPSGTAWHTAAKTPKLTITSGTDWGLVTAGTVTVVLFWYEP